MKQDGLNGDMEEMDWFRYLGLNLPEDGTMGAKVSHRVEAKVLGALKNVWKDRLVFVRLKIDMSESMVVPAMLHGCESWALNTKEWN